VMSIVCMNLYDTVFHSCTGSVHISQEGLVGLCPPVLQNNQHALRTDNTSAVLSVAVRSQVMPPG
jgi:hypothetical protein